ncbi:MAG: GNAT family N-acetyltransferase [Nitrospirota bacterium]|jgi:amino-acid N-acetyltransferase
MDSIHMRVAETCDIEAILALLAEEDREGFLLPLPADELARSIDDFLVATDGDRIVGVGRLKRFTDSLAEVRTLKVASDHRNQELGRGIVRALLQRARATTLRHVFVLTARTDFFERLGFVTIGREALPVKIWSDCLICYKRDACDEIAMWTTL